MHLQALSLSHKLKAVDFDILLSKTFKCFQFFIQNFALIITNRCEENTHDSV